MAYCILVDQLESEELENGEEAVFIQATCFYERSDTDRKTAEEAASYLEHCAAGAIATNLPDGFDDYDFELDETYWVNGPCEKCEINCPGRATLQPLNR